MQSIHQSISIWCQMQVYTGLGASFEVPRGEHAHTGSPSWAVTQRTVHFWLSSLTGLPNTKSKVVVKLIFTAQYSLPSLANTKKGSLKIFTVAKPRIGQQHKKPNLILSFTELLQRTACPETHSAACLLHLCSGKEKWLLQSQTQASKHLFKAEISVEQLTDRSIYLRVISRKRYLLVPASQISGFDAFSLSHMLGCWSDKTNFLNRPVCVGESHREWKQSAD